ncbi:MAG: SLC13 family permease, partial [Nitrososphaerales archaeon]
MSSDYEKWIPLQSRIRTIGFASGPIGFVLVLLYPIDGLSFEAKIVLGAGIWMAIWWVTETIPYYATALIPIILFPLLGAVSIDKVWLGYADKLVFLLLGGFLIAKAIEKANLHKRFALNTLKIVGTKPKNIVLGFIIVTGALSAWITNTATTLLILPIAVAVVSQMRDSPGKEKFGTCLLLSVAYAASLGGLSTLIGTAPNALFASLADSLAGAEITFSQWMLVGVPVSIVSLFVLWLYMVNFAKLDTKPISESKAVVVTELKKLGKMARNEKLVAATFAATALAWITRGLIWKDYAPLVDDYTIALIAALALFLLPGGLNKGRLLDLRTASKIPWGVLILIGGGLALASGFTLTGLDLWIAGQLSFVGGMEYLLIVLVIVTITIFTSELMSNTAVAALLIPIMASLAITTEVDPLLFMAPVAFATSYGFIMPVGTPPNAIVVGSGYVSPKKMAKFGLPFDLICIPLVTVMM